MKRLKILLFLFLANILCAQNALEHYRQAQKSFQHDDYWASIDSYRKALVLNPRYLDALEGQAEAFFFLGEYDEAYRLIQQALHLGKLRSSVQVLYGRILLGQSQTEQALTQFQEVLAREPKNLEPAFGLAEYQVMKGRLLQAINQFEELQKANPTNIRALLALLHLYSTTNNRQAFEHIFTQALKYHSFDARLHLAAAQFWYFTQEWEKAHEAFDSYSKLYTGEETAGWLLQAQLYIDEEHFTKALQTLDDKILKRISGPGIKDPRAWYLRGLALGKEEKISDAATAFQTAINLAPDNETYRLALENLLLRKIHSEDPRRETQGQLHFEQAEQYVQKNLLSMALDEYRRGLLLAPFSIKGRLARANIYKIQGLRTSMLDELETIAKTQPSYKEIAFLDEIEIQRNLYQDSVSARWGLKLSDFDRLNSSETNRLYRPYQIGVYYILDNRDISDFQATEIFSQTFCDEWGALRNLIFSAPPDDKAQAVTSFYQAFAQARQLKQDFFALLRFKQGPRELFGELKLYLGRTGRLVHSLSVNKKGSFYTTLGIRELAKSSGEYFATRGSIVKRDGSKILLNLGRRDGVAQGQKLLLLRDGASQLTGDSQRVAYHETDVLGTCTLTEVDDFSCEGTVEKNGFFDNLTIGDEALLLRDPPQTPELTLLPVSAQLQRNILQLR